MDVALEATALRPACASSRMCAHAQEVGGLSWHKGLHGHSPACTLVVVSITARLPARNSSTWCVATEIPLVAPLASEMVCRACAFSWSRGVIVSTLDPESSDRGSNPREACCKVGDTEVIPEKVRRQNCQARCQCWLMRPTSIRTDGLVV